MHLVKSMKQAAADRIVLARRDNPFTSVQDLTERASLDRGDLEALASANALESLSGHRHRAFWDVAGTERPLPLIPLSRTSSEDAEGQPMLRAPTEGQSIVADYCSTGLTLGRHPVSLLRDKLAREGCITASELAASRDGAEVRCAGLVVTRQRPGSANGVTFVTLEDETGSVQLVVWEKVGEEFRRVLIESHLLEVWGRLQSQDGVQHVIAKRLRNRSALLGDLVTKPRDFR
jgi:error-prone DNA polymerase